jgi:hypothetical protein
MTYSNPYSKYHFIILIILISLFIVSSSMSQIHNPESLLKNILEPAEPNFLTSNMKLHQYPAQFAIDSMYQIHSEFAYHDIYREWLNDKLILSSDQYDASTTILFPFRFQANPGIISLKFNYSNFSFKDHEKKDDTDVSIKQWPLYAVSGITGIRLSKHRLGLSWLAAYGEIQSEVFIKKYYHDPEDDLINRYFYDLLYPTFGEKIEFKPTHKQFEFSGEYIFSFNNQINTGLLLNKQWIRNKYRIAYVNSTSRLAGEKKLEAPLNGDAYNLHWINEIFYKPFTIRTDIGYGESNILFNLDAVNPTKSGDFYIDIRELADSSLSSEKFGAGLGVAWGIDETMDLSLSIARGKNSIHGKGELKTPVLGFELLPIAHQFEGKFDVDISIWSYHLGWKHQLRECVGYNIHLGYIDGKGVLTYNNLAKMEFGIGTSRFKDKIKYQINMYQAGLSLNYMICKKYFLIANIEQIIPDINERKKEAMPSEPPQKRKKRSYWGGTIYNIGLQYYF